MIAKAKMTAKAQADAAPAMPVVRGRTPAKEKVAATPTIQLLRPRQPEIIVEIVKVAG
jgi:hypothetical protein